MKPETVVATLERFFLDLIGTVLPGGVVLGGIWIVLGRPVVEGINLPPQDPFDWLVLVFASYVGGHVVASLSRMPVGFIGHAASRLRRLWGGFRKIVPDAFVAPQELVDKLADGPDFKGFADLVQDYFPWVRPGSSGTFFPARNLAISLVPEHQHRVFRFMFLSLLGFGVGAAILLVLLFWGGLALLGVLGWLSIPDRYDFGWGWAAAWIVLVALPLLERGFHFQAIAYRVPFSMGSIAVLQGAFKEAPTRKEVTRATAQPRIYLAGGFRSGWQDRVVAAWGRGDLFDPRQHGLDGEEEYTFWDLEAIRRSDWVLAYLEKTNPAGFALALEVGFAKALGKRVILVDEKSAGDPLVRRQLGMLWAAADVTFDDFGQALEYLASFRLVDGRSDALQRT